MKKITLKLMFTIAAVFLLFTGLMGSLAFAVPDIQAAYGITDISTSFAFMILGGTQLVLGIVA
jgi:hypothetical protein